MIEMFTKMIPNKSHLSVSSGFECVLQEAPKDPSQ